MLSFKYMKSLSPSLKNLRRLSSKAKVVVESSYVIPGLSKNGELENPQDFPSFILQNFLKSDRKDEIAIVCGASNDTMTYNDVYNGCYSFANALKSKYNINKNECVGILSPNHIQYFTAFNGISLVRGRSTTINPLYTVDEIKYQLESTNSKVLIAHPMCIENATKAANDLNIPLITFDKVSTNSIDSIYELIEDYNINKNDVDIMSFGGADPDSIMTIPFSSGTTGKPKGVMLTHKNLQSNILQSIPQEGRTMARDPITKERGSLMCPLPFFHIYGMIASMCLPLFMGAKLVFLPAFDLVRFLELLQEHKIQRAHCVPPIIIALAKQPIVEKYDLSNLKSIMSAAAPLGGELQLQAAEKLGIMIKQGWGMTELSPIGTVVPDPESWDKYTIMKHLKHYQGSAGTLAPATLGKIVCTETGNDLEYHQEGELMIKGPQVMKGYFNNEEATKHTIRDDGWMHTGDIGYFDDEGKLFITDRSKELIKYKGFQVAPAELEGILGTHDNIMDAIVIPVPNDEAGELPRAYIVKKPDSNLTEAEVADFVQRKVAPHKKLRGGVIFIDTIPKSASGKLLRRVMVQVDRGEIKV